MTAMFSQLQTPAGLRSQALGEIAFVGGKTTAPVQKRKQLQVRLQTRKRESVTYLKGSMGGSAPGFMAGYMYQEDKK